MDLDSDCRWLVLVPTEFELAKIMMHWPTALEQDCIVIEVCGFGPIAAAARTAQLIARMDPENVLLIGIAGSYTDQVPVGSATQFGQVGCYGVGLGQGENFEPATHLGWEQFSIAHKKIGDRIELAGNYNDLTLLTCAAASRTPSDVRCRTSLIPDAVAEDMEGFGMAMACELSDLTQRFIIRGISNRAGERNKKNWRIDEAIRSACQMAHQLIATCDE